MILIIFKMLAKFQSTPPRRRRQGERVLQYNEDVFNPRLREGGDFKRLGKYIRVSYFQSTPPRRRRPFFSCLVASINFFNPRLREGGDGKANKTEIKDIIFNPRLREGGDLYTDNARSFI